MSMQWASSIELLVFGAAALLVGMFLLLKGVILLAHRFQRRVFENLVPLAPGETLPRSAYGEAVADAARAAGFRPAGALRTNPSKSPVGCTTWVSHDGDVGVFCAFGKQLGVPLRRTLMVSYTQDGRCLATLDAPGDGTASELLESEIVLNADFDELLARHLERLEALDAPPLELTPENFLAQDLAFERYMVDLMQEAGEAVLAPDGASWRHTWRGARKAARDGARLQWDVAKAQKQRQRVKRPGTTGYVPSGARTQDPAARSEVAASKQAVCGSISLAMAMLFVAAVPLVTYLAPEPSDWRAALLSLAIVGGLFSIAVAGLVLGIIGWCESGTKSGHAIAGTLSNGALVVFITAAIVNGMLGA